MLSLLLLVLFQIRDKMMYLRADAASWMLSYLRVFKSIGSNFGVVLTTDAGLLLFSDFYGVCFSGTTAFSIILALGVTFPDFIFLGDEFYIFYNIVFLFLY